MAKIKTALLLPDIHHPHQSKQTMKAVEKFMADYRWDYLVYTGDAMNMDAVCHWNENKQRKLEGKRIKKEYDNFVSDVLNPHRELVGKRCKTVYLLGNHENWIEEALDKNPQAEGYWEAENNLPSWVEIIPFNKIYRLGKLRVIHGYYTNLHHAKKTVEAFERSVAYCHSHDIQFQTKVTADDVRDFHTGQSIGCLCNLNPDYAKDKPNRWVHGFGVVYIQPSGAYNLYQIVIANSQFIWNGKLYKG